MEATPTPSKSTRRCPICNEPVAEDNAFLPFCSKRCKLIDLGKWIKGDYKISRPIEEKDIEDED